MPFRISHKKDWLRIDYFGEIMTYFLQNKVMYSLLRCFDIIFLSRVNPLDKAVSIQTQLFSCKNMGLFMDLCNTIYLTLDIDGKK